MKNLALFFLIGFSCALQGMENVEEETNQKFIYAICFEKEAPETWQLFTKGSVPSRFCNSNINFGIYKVFQKDINISNFSIKIKEKIEEKSVPVCLRHRSLTFLVSGTQIAQIIKEEEEKNQLKKNLCQEYVLINKDDDFSISSITAEARSYYPGTKG